MSAATDKAKDRASATDKAKNNAKGSDKAKGARPGHRDRPSGSGREAVRWLWPMLWPYRRRMVLGALAVLAGTGTGLLMPYTVKVAIDRGVTAGDFGVLRTMVLAYLALALLEFGASRAETLLIAQVGERALRSIRSRLFAHLQRLSLDFYERERTGRIVARMTNDIEAMSNLVSGGLVNLVTSVVTLVGIAAVLVWLDWRLAVATLLVAPVVALSADRFRVLSADAWREVRETATTVTIRLQEALSGIRTIQSFRREPATAAGLAEAYNAERRAHQRTIVYASVFFPSVELLGTVASIIVLGFGGRRVLAGDLEVGTLVAFLLYLRNLFDPVQQLSELYDQFQSAVAGAERVGSVLNRQPSVREAPDAVALPARERPGAVRLDRVNFAYPTAAEGDDDTRRPGEQVLHDVSLDVAAGRTLALVGPTGAGKSTVAKLIARFYDPGPNRTRGSDPAGEGPEGPNRTRGSDPAGEGADGRGVVSLDGIDLRRLRLADLRGALGYVPQEGFLFSGTVADNIAYGRPGARRAEIVAAATAVGADELIADLPDGYDTEVGERGALLSAGERQLVAFARAWIADPKVLILDEATSNLDVVTERRIQQALRRLRADRTTILIAHRLSTVADADQVAVIEHGRVVESGSPAELLAGGGRYAQLHERWLAGAA
jgi:ABC-type multidrug transport system fused ATPase/permease subunit